MAKITDLPLEILTRVLTFLSFDDQVTAMTVCKNWCSASRAALKTQKGFLIGCYMGNKPFCEAIRPVGHFKRLPEYGIRLSQYQELHEREMKSRLSVMCPKIRILCASGDDPKITLILLKAYRLTLTHLELDSAVNLDEVGVFPLLEYLRYTTTDFESRYQNGRICASPKTVTSLKDTFPRLKYLDCKFLDSDLVRSLPRGLEGLNVYQSSGQLVLEVSRTKAKDSLQVLHVITDRVTSDVERFHLPNLRDVCFRGLVQMGNLFSSLSSCHLLTKLHVSARNCVHVETSVLLSAFSQLPCLTSLNLRFIILSDPVSFWTEMVALFGHKLQHLTFSTHFVTNESLTVIAGFAALRSLTLPFVYDQPFLFDNVPLDIRNRKPFTPTDLLTFLRSSTASRQTLTDISIQMESLGSEMTIIRDIESELQEMKDNHQLESAEVREQRNRNSIFL